jgi:hypothetical protein
MPRQLGPIMRAPAARTVAASRRSSPASPWARSMPEVMTSRPRVPRSSASSITAGAEAAGAQRTTSSGAAGRSRREDTEVVPWTTVPRAFTRWTSRRCAPCSAPRASQYPHLVGSAEAPTTATDRGSLKTDRSPVTSGP